MKCEICKKADAQTAITRERDGEEEELYVCHACAKAERQRRQKMSQRTRKFMGPGLEMSVTEIHPADDDDENTEDGEGLEPPPFLGALLNAFGEMADELEKDVKKIISEDGKVDEEEKLQPVPLEEVSAEYLMAGRLHLEGLSLIGETDAVKRAVKALGMELAGVWADGVTDTGHVYQLLAGPSQNPDQAKRVLDRLVNEEKNARVRLFEEMPRVFGDALCRALAILKNCRLLSPGEFFDLLSPLRLAAKERLLEGVTFKELEKYIKNIDLSSREENMEIPERDRIDSERADEMNERFMNVMLNERAEESFL